MLFSWQKKPLMTCAIVHNLPGRLRIHCRALGLLDEYKEEIKNRLSGDFAVLSVDTAPHSEALLICYDVNKSNARDILELTESILALYSTKAFQKDREIQNQLMVQERRIYEEPLSEMAIRIVVNLLSLAYGFIRRPSPPVTLFQ